jgi:hypothetical protein
MQCRIVGGESPRASKTAAGRRPAKHHCGSRSPVPPLFPLTAAGSAGVREERELARPPAPQATSAASPVACCFSTDAVVSSNVAQSRHRSISADKMTHVEPARDCSAQRLNLETSAWRGQPPHMAQIPGGNWPLNLYLAADHAGALTLVRPQVAHLSVAMPAVRGLALLE